MDITAATQKLALKPSGGLKSKEEFSSLMQAEYTQGLADLKEEFNDRSLKLKNSLKQKEFEYSFFAEIIEVNTANRSGNVAANLVAAVEKRIGDIDYLSAYESHTVSQWKYYYGEAKIIPVICDIVSYFLNRMSAKEFLSGGQLMAMVVGLVSAYPQLKIVELIFIMNKAMIGHYGHFQRIGVDVILGWITQYYDESSAYMEAHRISEKKGESRGESPWLVYERKFDRYRDEQLRKKEIVDSVWKKAEGNRAAIEAQESRNKAIENYKVSLTNPE